MRDEIVLLAKMEHKHVVKFHESYEDDRYIYIFMEYMENNVGL